MTKYATLTPLGSIDAIYLSDPRPAVDATEIPDDVFAGYIPDGNGGWSAPSPAPEPVPASVSAFQARAALARAGLLATVQAEIDAMPADDERRLAWDHAQAFERASPTIAALAATLGLIDEQIDDLFRTAATITA